MAKNRGHPRKNAGKEQNPSSPRASSSSSRSTSAGPLKPFLPSKASVSLRKHLVPATSPPLKVASPTQQQLSSPVATPVIQLQEERTSWAKVVSGSPTAASAVMSSAQLLLKSADGVPLSVSNNSSRKPIKIDFDDIVDEVHFWEFAVVCFILGANPPLHVMEGYVKRIWKDLNIDKFVMVAKGVNLVRFLEQQDRVKACDMNGFMFDKRPFIVKITMVGALYKIISKILSLHLKEVITPL